MSCQSHDQHDICRVGHRDRHDIDRAGQRWGCDRHDLCRVGQGVSAGEQIRVLDIYHDDNSSGPDVISGLRRLIRRKQLFGAGCHGRAAAPHPPLATLRGQVPAEVTSGPEELSS